MQEAEVLSKITGIFREVLELPNVVLTPQTVAADVKGWDSISHIDIVVRVEKEFAIKFTLREIQNLSKLGDLVELIIRKSDAV